MKLFVLVNTLLGPVVQGLEATHHVASFLLAGQQDPKLLKAITEWVADAERIIVVKKAGHHNDLGKIHAALISAKEIAGIEVETLKHSIHRDSRMNSCIMSIGILVPDEIVLATDCHNQGADALWDYWDKWTQTIMSTISNCPNAL